MAMMAILRVRQPGPLSIICLLFDFESSNISNRASHNHFSIALEVNYKRSGQHQRYEYNCREPNRSSEFLERNCRLPEPWCAYGAALGSGVEFAGAPPSGQKPQRRHCHALGT